MNGRNPHQALKSDIIGQARASRAEVVLARLQWGKEDIGFSLHINPNTYSTSGIQITDFLSYLDFRRSGCSFTTGRQCYVRWVDEGFDLSSFVASFDSSFAKLEDAEHDLEACGFFLNQPEGWGYFHGRQSGVSRRGADRMGGDGHTAMSVKQLKQSTDDIFDYRFTWLELDQFRDGSLTTDRSIRRCHRSYGACSNFSVSKHFANAPNSNSRSVLGAPSHMCHEETVSLITTPSGRIEGLMLMQPNSRPEFRNSLPQTVKLKNLV